MLQSNSHQLQLQALCVSGQGCQVARMLSTNQLNHPPPPPPQHPKEHAPFRFHLAPQQNTVPVGGCISNVPISRDETLPAIEHGRTGVEGGWYTDLLTEG